MIEIQHYQISLERVNTANGEPDLATLVTGEGTSIAKVNLHPLMVDYRQSGRE